jgi:hypothetical protein
LQGVETPCLDNCGYPKSIFTYGRLSKRVSKSTLSGLLSPLPNAVGRGFRGGDQV